MASYSVSGYCVYVDEARRNKTAITRSKSGFGEVALKRVPQAIILKISSMLGVIGAEPKTTELFLPSYVYTSSTTARAGNLSRLPAARDLMYTKVSLKVVYT